VSRPSGITVIVPSGSATSGEELERLVLKAHTELARTIGTSVLPMTVRLHDTLDSFRLATNRPWWVSAVAGGTTIDLAPATVLAQRGGLEASVRVAVAELLVAGALDGRPAWTRVGAARYFANKPGTSVPAPARARCPSDAELTLAVSASAQREAETRAEECFARELNAGRDWRTVR
jgi:hypothetical protein